MAPRATKKKKDTELKYVVFENDSELNQYFERYLKEKKIKPKKVFMVGNRDVEEVAEFFAEHDVLMINPNIMEHGQYNLMLMLMYRCLNENKLRIKELHIFSTRDVGQQLSDVWGDKRKYLDVVLKHLKIFVIDSGTCELNEIHI